MSMMALGQISDEVSLKFLEEVVGRSYWQPPRVPPIMRRYSNPDENMSQEEARVYLRQDAMGAGFGSVARERQPEVLVILRRLKEGDASDIYGQVEVEIQNMERYIASKPSRFRVTP
jgi:hypothetical protein